MADVVSAASTCSCHREKGDFKLLLDHCYAGRTQVFDIPKGGSKKGQDRGFVMLTVCFTHVVSSLCWGQQHFGKPFHPANKLTPIRACPYIMSLTVV